MAEPEAPLPDVNNIKKDRLEAAVTVASTEASEVAPSGNPMSTVSSLVTAGWVSAPAAGDFVTDLDGQGSTLRTAFDDAVDYFTELAAGQPGMVAHDDPRGNPANFSSRPPYF